MAIAKMKLAKFSGKFEKMDELIMSCCVDGNFHPEQGNQYISSSLGYFPFNESNPYKTLLEKVESISKISTVELDKKSDLSDIFIDDKTENRLKEIYDRLFDYENKLKALIKEKDNCSVGISMLKNYLDFDFDLSEIENGEFFTIHYGRLPIESYLKLNLEMGITAEQFEENFDNVNMDLKTRNSLLLHQSQMKSLSDEKRELIEQKDRCENGISALKYFEELNVDFELIGECEFITARFGKIPKNFYYKIEENYKDNPYMIFIPTSSDKENYWGAYFAPNNEIDEIDRIFASLHFEKFDIPEVSGEPKAVILELEKNLSIISDRLSEIDNKLEDINKSESKERGIYSLENTNHTVDSPYVMFLPSSMDKTHYWGVYFAPNESESAIHQIFTELSFEKLDILGVNGMPKEMISQLQEKFDNAEKNISEIRNDLDKYWKEISEEVNGIYSALLDLSKAFEIKYYSVVKSGYFFLVGWITASQQKKITKAVEEIGGIILDISDPEDDKTNTPPTKLKNFKLSRPFEFFVDMYGLPGYGEVDITNFVAVTYTLIFGIMFGDVGQGFVLAIAGLIMWLYKKMELGKALIPCGVSSMFFGFVFGSVFGFEETLNPLYKAVGLQEKPIEVMHSINKILLIAISIGVLLMVFSMLLNVYICIKRKKIGEAIFSHNGLVGISFYLSCVSLAVGFMSGKQFISTKVSFALLISGAILLFIKEIPIAIIDKHDNWKPESIGDFVAQNFFELFEYILSYASNTVSYLRVGAFVLVHAGMMMVVFSLAGEGNNIFVIILGNILVIALEGLLTGIQVLRLEFYEMFSRFYNGDGKPFNAIRIKNGKKIRYKTIYLNGRD